MDPRYQLMQVGAVCPRQASYLEPEVLVHFAELDNDTKAVNSVQQFIPMQLAKLLIPGSLWSAKGKMLSDGSNAYPEHRTLVIGKKRLQLCRLSKLFNSPEKRPDFLQVSHDNTWCAVLNIENERIIIPCFELLRIFFLLSAGSLSDYFFSRLPLDNLCWPLASPTLENNFTAHFCIASSVKLFGIARSVAELLFNPHYFKSVCSTYQNFAVEWQSCAEKKYPRESHVKMDFYLGRAINVKAHGAAFMLNNERCFWVSQLLVKDDWYGFKHVVYHGLEAAKEARLFEFEPPYFQDMLKGRQPRARITVAADMSVDFQNFGSNRNKFPLPRIINPSVSQSFAWGKAMPSLLPPVFATSTIIDNLWARPGYSHPINEKVLPFNQRFHEILNNFSEIGCTTSLLEINNQNQEFGTGRSVFPYCSPNSYTHLSDFRYRPISIANIKWKGKNFYLFNILGEYEVVLSYRKDLKKWLNKECKNFLLVAMELSFNWMRINELDNDAFNAHEILVNHAENDELLCRSYFKAMRHAIFAQQIYLAK